MDVTASSSYTLTNVSYSNDGSNVRCSAAGSSLLVNSSDVYFAGKSVHPIIVLHSVFHQDIYLPGIMLCSYQFPVLSYIILYKVYYPWILCYFGCIYVWVCDVICLL